MPQLPSHINLQVNDKLYLKNPESSPLGGRIISGSISLIHQLGFEKFTFRKLGKEIQSTEPSVYRYFENKHMLLLYLINWYWAWLDYKLVFRVANINSPQERLARAIALLTEQVQEDSNITPHQ
ncbi:MAG: TetR/AcrR family transcriptional regulator [Owenweeksia sp.]|nr:TetR/AcrR family transcriptional regulator [Owenweeksia sp.]